MRLVERQVRLFVNIVPTGLGELLGGPDPVKSQRAMQAMLQMKKLDIDALRRAYEGQ